MPIEGATVYMLLCADGAYYTGLTRKNVDERVSEHIRESMKGSRRRAGRFAFSGLHISNA